MEVGRPGRKGCGRRRIEIKKIENQRKRWVAFSKRKKGLLSKADRLSSLSGEDIGIVIISEQGRVYTSDNADSVINRYRSMVKDSNSVGRDKERFETRCRHEASTLPSCRRHDGHDNDADQTIVKERDDRSQEMGTTPALETLDLICQLENSIPCPDPNNDAADVTNHYRSRKMVEGRDDHDIENESAMLELKLWSSGHERRASATTSADDDDNDDNDDDDEDDNEDEDVDNDSGESKNGREVEEQALIPLIDPNKIPDDELS